MAQKGPHSILGLPAQLHARSDARLRLVAWRRPSCPIRHPQHHLLRPRRRRNHPLRRQLAPPLDVSDPAALQDDNLDGTLDPGGRELHLREYLRILVPAVVR